ncbi:DUF2061 domain-containing protein, partial [Fulvivirga sp. RKSG066]|uniref:DUF2061 domain-containing protein n=1 Tax=Fulvivirga aurantia TaxID=2529383 RepID=UPI0012BCD0CC
MKDSHARSLTKAITWRVLGTLDTIFLAFIITDQLNTAISIGATEVFTKIALFYFHERVWNKLLIGRSTTGVKIYRSVIKTVSWRITGTLDTILLTYLFTGGIGTALSVGATELFTKMLLYFLHERVWTKVKWGRVEALE